MRVLLIEPNKILATTYTQALVRSNHDVDWHCGAQTAIHAIDINRPDVIVLEPQLVSHSGIEFLYELRSYSDLQDIPVVVHSFVPDTAFSSQTKMLDRLGVALYLYKPQTNLRQFIAGLNTVAQPVAT